MASCISRVSVVNQHIRSPEPGLMFIVFGLARETLPLWDKQIQSLCYQVNKVIEKIGVAEPEWMARTMDEQMTH